MTTPRQRTERILELTEQMVRCAREEDWVGVVERNRLRDAEARALFDGSIPAGERAFVRERLERVLEVEAEARERMTRERDDLGRASREHHRGRTASDAYHRFGS